MNRELAVLVAEQARLHPAGSDARKSALCLHACLVTTSTVPGARRALGEIEQPGLRSAARTLLEELAAGAEAVLR